MNRFYEFTPEELMEINGGDSTTTTNTFSAAGYTHSWGHTQC